MKIFGNIFILIASLLTQIIFLNGQNNNLGRSNISNDIIESKNNAGAFEISEIVFEGNTYFTTEELHGYIISKSTKISIPNKILSTYYKESRKNKHFPKVFVHQLNNSLNQFSNEYKYFNKDIVEEDIKVLMDLYNVNGFHFANVTYYFQSKNNNKENILTFRIKENNNYTLASSITYKGIETLDNDVKKRLDTLIKIKQGDTFNEEIIENEIKAVNNLFLRTGYMNSKWNYPNVIMDTIKHTDSIVVSFNLGNRIKIGKIIFADSSYGQKIVANSTKKKFIRFKEGEYYNQGRKDRSIDNLYSTGVFESVNIDTLARDYTDGDFTRDFIITSKYRKLRDWDGDITYNKTIVDQFHNLGVSAGIFHRNMFGGAQAVRLYGRITLKDVQRTIFKTISNLSFSDIEFAIGTSYSQPILWQSENNTRVDLSARVEYSWELLNGLFNISKISIPISFPTRFARNSLFSNLNVELLLSREDPVNYASVVNNALDNAETLQDTNNILSSLNLYDKIYNYLNEPTWHTFTSNLFSISLTRDDRDNIFVPSKGSMTNISLDGFNPIFFHRWVSGGAKYYRIQATHTRFWQLSKTSVFGVKGKIGHTFVFDEKNSFVPQDRQFFAGGANSVRAWQARDLRYSNFEEKLLDETIKNFSKNYIGSRTLIDGSIELRRKLNDIPGFSEDLRFLIDGLGLGFFIDFGNTFGWYNDEEDKNINLTDYITKLAVGTGIGIRYETPIGPFRLDFATPLYDPLGKRKAFDNLVLVFGIGHAF